MSYRSSRVVEQLITQVTGSIESLVKELFVVRQLVRAGRAELVEHRLPAVGQTAVSGPLIERGGAFWLNHCWLLGPNLTEGLVGAKHPVELDLECQRTLPSTVLTVSDRVMVLSESALASVGGRLPGTGLSPEVAAMSNYCRNYCLWLIHPLVEKSLVAYSEISSEKKENLSVCQKERTNYCNHVNFFYLLENS